MSVRHAILGLLHYRDLHGYSIKEHLEDDFGNMWSVNYGQIYPALKKMLEEDLVTMKEVEQEGAPAKKLYSITKEGREEFARWLNGPPERPMIIRDPFLLRFTFSAFGDEKKALENIEYQISLYEQELERRREKLPRRKKASKQVQLMSDLGVNFNEMMLDWLKRARKELKNKN